jgi:hypothetical protein
MSAAIQPTEAELAMLDALSHIARVCAGSRQSTRRIRWIEQRAKSAIAGDDEWKAIDLPRHEPGIERLETMVGSIYQYAKRELEGLIENYTDEGGMILDENIQRDVDMLRRFVADAIRNVEFIRAAERGRLPT